MTQQAYLDYFLWLCAPLRVDSHALICARHSKGSTHICPSKLDFSALVELKHPGKIMVSGCLQSAKELKGLTSYGGGMRAWANWALLEWGFRAETLLCWRYRRALPGVHQSESPLWVHYSSLCLKMKNKFETDKHAHMSISLCMPANIQL